MCLTSSSGAQSTAALRCAIRVPGGAVDAEMHRRDARQQAEDAGDRAQVAAPDALALAIHPADADGGDGGTAEDQQRRLRVVIDADQLAIDRGEDEGHHRPAAPAHPFRDRAAAPVAAGEFGQRAFRAEHAAPDAAHEHDREDHEGPPDAPEQVLREQHQAVLPAGDVGGLVGWGLHARGAHAAVDGEVAPKSEENSRASGCGCGRKAGRATSTR
jgi:hypothetical protein